MRTIAHCLNKQLLEISRQAMQLEALNDKLRQFLQPPLREHCQIGSFNKGCLILTTSDAAWATQLRYEIPMLRDKLRAEAGLYQLLSIQIKVSTPSNNQPASVKGRQAILSEKARATILNAADECQYKPLQKAFYSLGKTPYQDEKPE